MFSPEKLAILASAGLPGVPSRQSVPETVRKAGWIIMPDLAVHASFGREVRRTLPPEVESALVSPAWELGQFGPDLWFMHRPWKRRSGRGRHMHTTRTGAFLTALARQAKDSSSRDLVFSYLAGFLCHYALDSTAHPWIIYVTAVERRFPRSHMSLEHALDMAQIARDGFAGEKHPVSSHYFPDAPLPRALEKDLDAVFEKVYGWKHAFPAFRRSGKLYLRSYRLLENPGGLAARLARGTKADLLRSLAYSESQFLSLDPENLEHRTWHHSHDSSVTRSDSFPELREEAAILARRLILAAWDYLHGRMPEKDLEALIGSRSYLSGLPTDDERNHSVASLLPPKSKK